MPVVGICDYGVGNLRSVERALRASSARTLISADPDAIAACDALVLPGVGAFAIAARALSDTGLGGAVRHVAVTGAPVLGVCLGHQLLFERSEEGESVHGLGLLDGAVTRLVPGDGAKVPHMGWNTVLPVRTSRLLDGIAPGTYMYFVHSYAAAAAQEDAVAVTEHGRMFTAAVERDNVMGTQFHPEKSGTAGLRVYANFVALCAARTPVSRAG